MYSGQLAVKTMASPATRRRRSQSYRRRQRVTLHILAEAKNAQEKRLGWLLDLGVDGMFFRTQNPFEAGETISIDFYLPQINETVRCMAKVETHVPNGGLGPGGNRLKFQVLRPAVRHAINAFVEQSLKARLDLQKPKHVEVSLLTEGLGNLPNIQELSRKPVIAASIDSLPDVGAFLEVLSDDDTWEPHNDVGVISPEDLILIARPTC